MSGDRDELAALFARAGVTSVEITARKGTVKFPSVRLMVEADLRGWLPMMGVVLPEDLICRILHEAEHLLNPFVTQEGTIEFDTRTHIATGTKR